MDQVDVTRFRYPIRPLYYASKFSWMIYMLISEMDSDGSGIHENSVNYGYDWTISRVEQITANRLAMSHIENALVMKHLV